MAASLQVLKDPQLKAQADDLVKVVRFFEAKSWCPATATNFSVRAAGRDGQIIISQSGIDKSEFTAEHLMLVDPRGGALDPLDAKSSAETLIHTTLYELKSVNAVLHTHSVPGTVLSMLYGRGKKIKYAGYELLKGFEGNKTHELTEVLPIIRNTQDMVQMSTMVRTLLAEFPKMHGFLIEGHGLYTWGSTLAIAKRQIETYEFLFECHLKRISIPNGE